MNTSADAFNPTKSIKPHTTPEAPNVILEFPFRIQQLDETSVSIKLAPGITFVSVDCVQRSFPWMSIDAIDKLVEDLYVQARTEAIKQSIRIK